MPFGIKSAPEVFQRRMHEVVEGLQGVEVVADDFVVVGCGNADEATQNHDQNLDAFLQRCKERNLKLNDKKLKLRISLHDNPHKPGHRPPTQSEINVTLSYGGSDLYDVFP